MVSTDDIKNLAELARLELSEREVEGLQKDISNILEYVGQISAVSTDNQVPVPTTHNVLRADVPRTNDDLLAGKRERILAALPKRLPAQVGEGDYTVVRKIIQKDE